jgi:hypothetical protein
LVEEDFHILYGIDSHAGFAYVSYYTRMVAVIASVGGQVEGHGEPFLAGG